MKKDETYPAFFKRSDGSLTAFSGPDKMYMVSPTGSNTNPGVTLDHFITRKMVLKHYGYGERITAGQFTTLYQKIYTAYLDHIVNQ
jgi:hypothetical protein